MRRGEGKRFVRTCVVGAGMVLGMPASSARAETKQACIAAADAGQQLRDEGKYGQARASFVACARESCPTVIAKSCMQWQRDLDAQTPTVVVAARDERGNDLAAARVVVDGTVVRERLDGLPIAIDPGEHQIRIERGEHDAREARVVLHAGEKGRAVAFAFSNASTNDSDAPLDTGPAANTAASSARDDESPPAAQRSLFTARNVTVASLGAAAILAAGGAIYFGAQSRSEADVAAGYRASNGVSACVQSTSATCSAWSDAVDAQNRDATANKVLFVASGVFGLAAIGTFVLWPSAARTQSASFAPVLGPGFAGLRVGGGF